MGPKCTDSEVSSNRCPESSSYISENIGTGSESWQVRENTTVKAFDGSSSSAQAIGPTFNF